MSNPTLRAHNVGSLDSRVEVLRKLFNSPNGGIRNPKMRQIGLLVTQHVMARDDLGELRAIYEFVKRNVRYTGDITFKDTFQSALRTLEMGGGDCDDHGELVAVIGAENGYQPKWRITSNTGASWDHIYCLLGVPKHRPTRWIALDTTLPGNRFGQEPPRAKYRDFDVMSGED